MIPLIRRRKGAELNLSIEWISFENECYYEIEYNIFLQNTNSNYTCKVNVVANQQQQQQKYLQVPEHQLLQSYGPLLLFFPP